MSRHLSTAAAAAVLLAAMPAMAHVELQADKAPAGSSYKAVLMVPHGCAGSPTVALRVQIPDGLVGTKPMAKPGWKVSVKAAKLAQPVEIEGETITQAVKEIDWSGGSLPDSLYDEFAFVTNLPDKPGTTLEITMKYSLDRTRTIAGIKRVSKPGLRIYARADGMPRVLGGMGVAVVSTSDSV